MVKYFLFVIFNFIISHVSPENFLKTPQILDDDDDDDNDDDDYGDDDDKLFFFGMADQRKMLSIISSLRHAACRV